MKKIREWLANRLFDFVLVTRLLCAAFVYGNDGEEDDEYYC